ncbi:MAG: alpha/beta fold hydrolase, partial [Acidobacteriaceae bacterium]|nr:alpha/beta fold hydrolase [Acidobacteriaceae bacterium]
MKQTGSAERVGQVTPVQRLSIGLSGKEVCYLRAGSGPPLLLVHGLLGYSFSWRHTIPALAEIATIYALDLPGAGYSEPIPNMDCGFRACAERVLRFMDGVGVRDFDLLGTSHGGAVAMMMAALSAERVRRLILVDPVNPWSAHGQVLSVVLTNFLVAPIFTHLTPRMPLLQRFYFRRLFGDKGRIRPGTLEGYI